MLGCLLLVFVGFIGGLIAGYARGCATEAPRVKRLQEYATDAVLVERVPTDEEWLQMCARSDRRTE